MAKTTRIGVLASGGGSNLQAIIDSVEAGKIMAEMAVVISDKEDAFALERARKHGITAEYLDPKKGRRREDYDMTVLASLRRHKVDLVLLAGYMRLVSPVLIEAYPWKMMNIHPALLPAFPGLHVQKKAADYGVRFSGCTVHFVDGGMDTGPVIIQAVVPVLPDDDGDTLGARILKQEHRIYPEAVRLFTEGKLKVAGRKVIVKGSFAKDDACMINPPIKG
ncbi:MAG: phosphoribosylglycinamide formyltransferase [Nitrospirae bacterium]|nr:phosphoribosylglycinamide formyltransferase [Nitrospirota bacterium]